MNPSPPHHSNVILIGLMGSGKSTVGKIAAHSLGFKFVDTDHLIIQQAGCSIAEIFAAEGEEGFRRRETEALHSLQGTERLIIATGGGIVTRPENLPMLQSLGYVVWLDADPLALHQRTAHQTERPLLRNDDPAGTLQRLHAARKPLYSEACHLRITTDNLTADEVAYGLAESIRATFNARRTA